MAPARPESPSSGLACTGSGFSKIQAWLSTRAPAGHRSALALAPAYDHKGKSINNGTSPSQYLLQMNPKSPPPPHPPIQHHHHLQIPQVPLQ